MSDEKAQATEAPAGAASALSAMLERGAKSGGFDLHWHSKGRLEITQGQLERFARFLVSDERKACAAVAERVCREHADPVAGYAAAEAIRMRSNVELTGAAPHERKTKP